jgi:hypothetical protein
MRLAFLIFLLAAGSGPALLTDDVLQLPAGEWRWVRFEIRQQPAVLECRFQTVGGGAARAELVSVQNLELLRQHKSHDALASTDTLDAASFRRLLGEPGDYAVVLENPSGRPVAARLTVTMSFHTALAPVARYLPQNRRLVVILASFGVFFAILGLSARAFLANRGK